MVAITGLCVFFSMSRSDGELFLSVAVSPCPRDKVRPSDTEPLIRAISMEKAVQIRFRNEGTCFEVQSGNRNIRLEELGWTK